MTVTQQPYTSTTKLEEGIVGVDGTSNQAVNRCIDTTRPLVSMLEVCGIT